MPLSPISHVIVSSTQYTLKSQLYRQDWADKPLEVSTLMVVELKNSYRVYLSTCEFAASKD
jgi:hypothetical protein